MFAARNLPAQLGHHGLLAVADPQNRHAHLEQSGRRAG